MFAMGVAIRHDVERYRQRERTYTVAPQLTALDGSATEAARTCRNLFGSEESDSTPRTMDSPLTDAFSIDEDRMRAALQSSGPPSPSSSAPRGRHRFVQDGEVPVVVVHGRHRAPEETRAAITALEHTLDLERAARAASEKSLMQAEETIRQLRTRLAHAELAREERLREDAAREEAARDELAREEAARELATRVQAVREEALREEATQEQVGSIEAAAPQPAGDPAAKRGRRRKADAEPAAEPDAEEEAIEWWRPGWKERLRRAG